MSYIRGQLQKQFQNQQAQVIGSVQIKFYMDIVFPQVQVFEYQTMKSTYLSYKDLLGVNNEVGRQALAFKSQEAGIALIIILEKVFTEHNDELSANASQQVINAIIARSEQIARDLEKPYIIPVQQTIRPNNFDFADNYDAQLAIYDSVTHMNRLCGYANIAIASMSECKSHFGVKGIKDAQIVVDTEFSGSFCTGINKDTYFQFHDGELQLDLVIQDCTPMFTLLLQLYDDSQYQSLKKTLLSSYQAALKAIQSTEEAETITQTLQQGSKISAESYAENVEDAPTYRFSRQYKNVEVQNSRLLSTIDQYVNIVTNEVSSELILKDLQNQQFSGKVKLDGAETTTLLTQDSQKNDHVYIFDAVKGVVAQDLEHVIRGSTNVTTSILDFSAGNNCQSLMNTPLTSSNGVVGISSNSLFVLDRRLKGSEATVSELKLVSGPKYTQMLITKGGSVILGNALGDVSLFWKGGQKALNKFPGSGFPVTALCLDKTEEWLIVTTRFSIMLYSLIGMDGENALRQTIKKANRKEPILAALSPSAVSSLQMDPIGLRPAFLTRGKLVSGSSRFLLVWDFEKLINKQGQVATRLPLKADLLAGGEYQGKAIVGLETGWSRVDKI